MCPTSARSRTHLGYIPCSGASCPPSVSSPQQYVSAVPLKSHPIALIGLHHAIMATPLCQHWESHLANPPHPTWYLVPLYRRCCWPDLGQNNWLPGSHLTPWPNKWPPDLTKSPDYTLDSQEQMPALPHGECISYFAWLCDQMFDRK